MDYGIEYFNRWRIYITLMMDAYIKGISYYLREVILTDEELVKEFPEWSVDKIASKVGVN
mgnify:CR=1 FL=1